MLKLFSSTFLILVAFFCGAQGSWNIGYLKIDSISKEHIGQSVRIDFKSKDPWTGTDGKRYIRSYVGMMDTGNITIDTTTFIFAERRKIYTDHGSYTDQYLECINCRDETRFLYDVEILDVDRHSVYFRLSLGKKPPGQAKKETLTVRIDKEKLDGVMYIQ